MNPDASPPSGIEVLPAAAEQEPVLANLVELYAHDFSELVDVRIQPDGRFGYPELARFWKEEGRFPFLVRVDGYLAGFALVAQGSRISGDPRVWDMVDFFIARGYRKQGIGAEVAHELWRRFPGAWEVRVLGNNHTARSFWRGAIAAFTGSPAESRVMELQGKEWEVFAFVSPAGAGGK